MPNRALGAYLRALLLERPSYLRRWHLKQGSPAEVNQAAIARVLLAHLCDIGELSDHTKVRTLKDRVSRAFNGDISPDTLRAFIGAFHMSEYDSKKLWRLLNSEFLLNFVEGALALDGVVVRQQQSHATRAFHDTLVIDRHGKVCQHRTIQIPVNTGRQLRHVRLWLDTKVRGISFSRGSNEHSLYRDPQLPQFQLCDIALLRPLAQGEATKLEYEMKFGPGNIQEYRRTLYTLTETCWFQVQFDAQKLPKAVWWCTWPDNQSPPITQERLELRPDHMATKNLDFARRAVVGFRWEW